MIHRSRYDAKVQGGAILIFDRSIEGSGVDAISVTNDAERVVADLKDRGLGIALPVIYRDSMGRWDGMTVIDGRFAGFYPLAEDYGDARKRLDRMVAENSPSLGDARRV